MNGFDAIPEDEAQAFQCEACGGSMKRNVRETQGHFPDGTLRIVPYVTWDCDTCINSELEQGSVK